MSPDFNHLGAFSVPHSPSSLPPDDVNLAQKSCLLGIFITKWGLYSSADTRSM